LFFWKGSEKVLVKDSPPLRPILGLVVCLGDGRSTKARSVGSLKDLVPRAELLDGVIQIVVLALAFPALLVEGESLLGDLVDLSPSN